jgi:hypothetical protein
VLVEYEIRFFAAVGIGVFCYPILIEIAVISTPRCKGEAGDDVYQKDGFFLFTYGRFRGHFSILPADYVKRF